MSNGKGDKRRPMQISQEEWARRWAAAYGKKKRKKKTK